MIERITDHDTLLSIIVRADFSAPGISFFTPDEFSQQLAYMHHPAGKEIEPHVHNAIPREVQFTQEVLFIRRGKLRVDFYGTDRQYLESRELGAGDTILLAAGGHGFEVLEDLEMIEVKQGPYTGDENKTRFSGVDRTQLRMER